MRTAALLFFCVQLWTGGSQDQRDTAWFLKALVKGCTWNSCVVPLTTGDDPRSSSVQLHHRGARCQCSQTERTTTSQTRPARPEHRRVTSSHEAAGIDLDWFYRFRLHPPSPVSVHDPYPSLFRVGWVASLTCTSMTCPAMLCWLRPELHRVMQKTSPTSEMESADWTVLSCTMVSV